MEYDIQKIASSLISFRLRRISEPDLHNYLSFFVGGRFIRPRYGPHVRG
jgi:hypothetical protein